MININKTVYCVFVHPSAQPTASGLHDFDYPSLLDTGIGIDGLSEISHVKRVPLPPELVEQFGRILVDLLFPFE